MTRLLLALALTGCASSVRLSSVGDVEVATVRRGYSNVHLVRSGESLVIFDTGYPQHVGALERGMRRLGAEWTDVDAVIVSHGHADHAGGAAWLGEQTGAPVIVGEADLGMTSTGTNAPLCPTSRMAERRETRDATVTYEPFQPDVVVPHNQGIGLTHLLDTPGIAGEVLAEDGHTGGSLMYVVGGAAFVGDMFRGSITGHEAVRHFYMCDLEDNVSDVVFFLEEDARDATVFYTGHFGPVDRESVEAMLVDWAEE